MSIPTPYLIAIALAAGVGGWMLSGDIVTGGRPDARPVTISERNETAENDLFKVEATLFQARPRLSFIEVRGSTEASSNVSVRSETVCILERRHVRKGQQVAAGDLICSIRIGDREAMVAQRSAELKKAEIDLQSARKLVSQGYATQVRLNENKADMDAAIAAMKSAEIELERTEIRAPIDGIIQDPFAKVGDMLQLGDICANVMDPNSMKMIAQVSERFVGRLSVESKANIKLVTGEEVDGIIKFIAPSADTETRTFRLEIALPNNQAKIRDGITAVAKIPLPGDKAHLVPASVLTLDDAGKVGVRVVDNDNMVAFMPVKILQDDRKGMWVGGLDETVRIITRGQEYVISGQKVDTVIKTAEAAQ